MLDGRFPSKNGGFGLNHLKGNRIDLEYAFLPTRPVFQLSSIAFLSDSPMAAKGVIIPFYSH